VKAVVPWSSDLFVVDSAPIVETVKRFSRKGSREVVARCSTHEDADRAADWLVDRLSRFAPDQRFATEVKPGDGQFLLALTTR
jgi:hypothetical protein